MNAMGSAFGITFACVLALLFGDFAHAAASPPSLAAKHPASQAPSATPDSTRAPELVVGLRVTIAGPTDAEKQHFSITGVDGEGNALVGTRRYRLHFDRDDLPPRGTRWSLFSYSLDTFRGGYGQELGDDRFQYNPDGSLDVFVGSGPPQDSGSTTNWLSVPPREFTFVARIRSPETFVFSEWALPPLRPTLRGR